MELFPNVKQVIFIYILASCVFHYSHSILTSIILIVINDIRIPQMHGKVFQLFI